MNQYYFLNCVLSCVFKNDVTEVSILLTSRLHAVIYRYADLPARLGTQVRYPSGKQFKYKCAAN